MPTLIVKIDTANHAAQVTNFLKTIPYIKSVIAEPRKSSLPVRQAGSSLTAADWVRPGRPATDEEIEQMLDECEAEEGIPLKEAREQTLKELKGWEAKRKK
mgnify:CR=1 FL=1